MKWKRHALGIWVNVSGCGIPLLLMLAYVLDWSSAVRLMLMVAVGVTAVGNPIALMGWDRWRTERTRRRRAHKARLRRLVRSVPFRSLRRTRT